jgi:intermediate cleaving peptidase 55
VLSTLGEIYPTSFRGQGRLLEVLAASKAMPLRPVISELRVFKSPAEIRNMRLAGKFSGRSFTDAMRRRFTKEKDLCAFLEYEFKLQGCDTSAYVPVVAGGKVRVRDILLMFGY